MFFDIEGDPFYEDGLEYLWGLTCVEDGEETFRAFWGRDRTEEKQAFEGFIDFVIARRERHPEHARLPLRSLRANGDRALDGIRMRRARTRSTSCCARTCSWISTEWSSRRFESLSRATR